MNTKQKLLRKIVLRNFRSYRDFVEIDLYTRAPNNQSLYSIGDVELNQLKYTSTKWVNAVTGVMGVNASGKTSLLEGIAFGYEVLNGILLRKMIEETKRRISKARYEIDEEGMRGGNSGSMMSSALIVNTIMNNAVKKFSSNGEDINSTISLRFTDGTFGNITVGHFESINGNYSDIRVTTNEVVSPISFRDILFNIFDGLINKTKESPLYVNNIVKESIFFRGLNVYFHQRNKGGSNFLSEQSRYKRLFESLRRELGIGKFMKLAQRLDHNIDEITMNGVVVLNNGARLEPQKLSNGTKKVLWNINDMIKMKKAGGLILIDEIENGLNLSLIKLIIKDVEIDIDLDEQKPVQLIFTSHTNTIQERGIVDPNNTLFIENGSISKINVRNGERIENIPWKDQRTSSFKNKNYWNDSYWDAKELKPKSTLSNYDINKILEIVNAKD